MGWRSSWRGRRCWGLGRRLGRRRDGIGRRLCQLRGDSVSQFGNADDQNHERSEDGDANKHQRYGFERLISRNSRHLGFCDPFSIALILPALCGLSNDLAPGRRCTYRSLAAIALMENSLNPAFSSSGTQVLHTGAGPQYGIASRDSAVSRQGKTNPSKHSHSTHKERHLLYSGLIFWNH